MSVVKLRRARSGTGGVVTSITIPKDLADALDQADVHTFSVSLTEDGILLRPMKSEPESSVKPTWLTGTRGVKARASAKKVRQAAEATASGA